MFVASLGSQSIAVQHAAVKAYATLHMHWTDVVGRSHKSTHVPQPVGRNKHLFAQVLRALPHTPNARCKFPAVPVANQVAHVVSQRVQTEVQTVFVGRLFILLAPVLLIAYGSLQLVLTQPE